MNPNIEVITPVLWGVNSFYVKAGWTKELLPIPQPPDQLLTGSKDVSLTDTTAEITINQSNENHITNGMDLDGVISAMAEGLAEAIDTAAEGIHE